jgi:hypothetical protein
MDVDVDREVEACASVILERLIILIANSDVRSRSRARRLCADLRGLSIAIDRDAAWSQNLVSMSDLSDALLRLLLQSAYLRSSPRLIMSLPSLASSLQFLLPHSGASLAHLPDDRVVCEEDGVVRLDLVPVDDRPPLGDEVGALILEVDVVRVLQRETQNRSRSDNRLALQHHRIVTSKLCALTSQTSMVRRDT